MERGGNHNPTSFRKAVRTDRRRPPFGGKKISRIRSQPMITPQTTERRVTVGVGGPRRSDHRGKLGYHRPGKCARMPASTRSKTRAGPAYFAAACRSRRRSAPMMAPIQRRQVDPGRALVQALVPSHFGLRSARFSANRFMLCWLDDYLVCCPVIEPRIPEVKQMSDAARDGVAG